MKHIIILLFTLVIYAKSLFSQAKTNSDTSKNKKEQLRWIPANQVVFDRPEIEAEFPGGEQKWFEFIAKGLNREIPINNKAPKGQYDIIIRFIINGDGNLLDFVAETNQGYGMEDEVIRLLKTSPDWNPAKTDGNDVNSLKRQAIRFIVE